MANWHRPLEYEEMLNDEAYKITTGTCRSRGPEFLTLQHGFMVHKTLPAPKNPMVSLLLPCNNNCGSNYNSMPDTVNLLSVLIYYERLNLPGTVGSAA